MITKEQILSVTSSYLIKEGCRKVTMDEIAALNGISKRTLYETFADKTDVLTQCVDYVHTLFNKGLEYYMEGGCSIEDVFAFFQSEDGSRKVMEFNMFMKEIRKYYPEIFARNASLFKETHETRMAGLLRKAQEEGFVRKSIDVDEHAAIITGLCETAMALDGQGKDRSAGIHRTLLHTYLRGLATIEGITTLEKFSLKDDGKSK